MRSDGHPQPQESAPDAGANPAGAAPQWLTIDEIANTPAAPNPPRPQPTPQPTAAQPAAPVATAPEPELQATPHVPVSESVPQPPAAPQQSARPTALPPTPQPPVSAAGAASQIAELLRAAHDTAARLRNHAEVEVRRSVEAARAEVSAHKQSQMRALDAEQAAAEQLNAEIVHNARLAATEVRNRAEQEAAEIRAAAEAVLAQAAAHAHAAKALVAHNLAEIEAAKQETTDRGAEMLGAGRHMVATIEGLDDALSERLSHTDQVLGWAQGAITRQAS